jgi:hypothetical protein
VCGSNFQCRAPCGPTTTCGLGATTCSGNQCLDPHNPVDEIAITGGTPLGGSSDGGGGADAIADAPVDQASGATSVDATPDVPFVANPAAGALWFMPTNFSLLGLDAGPTGDAGIFTGAPDVLNNVQNGVPDWTITQNDVNQTPADLYVLHSLTIDPTSSVTISGPRPVILLVLTTVNIQGPVYVTAGSFGGDVYAGPGEPPATSQGIAYPESTDYGGSYCGVGGAAAVSGANEPTGQTYGNASISPLMGGSGSGCNCGGGGGAVQIVAGTSITIGTNGFISAGGSAGYGGGASGGAILLEAPSVVIRGNLAANGGGGRGYANGSTSGTSGTPNDQPAPGGAPNGGTSGGAGSAGASVNGGAAGAVLDGVPGFSAAGGGGAGWIRINTVTGVANVTGIISPHMSTPCATQGTLAP